MNRHHKTLELDRILNLLADETSCDDARDMAMTLEASGDLDEVRKRLDRTNAAAMLMARFGAPSFGHLKNVQSSVRRAEAGGGLNMRELLNVAETLRVIRALKEWRDKSAGIKSCLDDFFDKLEPNKYLEERIFTSITNDEEMSDHASPELYEIRRKIVSASLKARDHLEKMIRSQTTQRYLQDPIVTIRNDRFVIPVKAEFRGEISGLVHDTSSSGATVFVEPMAVVEANNEIKLLRAREQDEIDRILMELSAETGGFCEQISNSYRIAVILDFQFAKGGLSFKMKASVPELNDKGVIELNKARHPLIDNSKVVPIDIRLGTDFDTMMITGPNTGGKTVTLKTLGLLTLMAACGLMIPVSDNSKISVFQSVLSDIGDEQSIEQSLSTFSSHITNIINIIDEAGERSLVLLDELGAGTDPVEGAAIAVAILEKLRSKGAEIAATTHYSELKSYAINTDGIVNASCEFDVATLRPTYRLLIGVPGRSNAFAISERLGMPTEVVDRARELVSAENSRFENVVEQLDTIRKQMETEKEEAERHKLEAKRVEERSNRIIEDMEKERKNELELARAEAKKIVDRAKLQYENMLNEIEETKKKLKNADNGALLEARSNLRGKLREAENQADPVEKRSNKNYKLPRPLKVGDEVLIFDIDKKAAVLALADGGGFVEVQAGIIKTRVKLENLRLIGESSQKTVHKQMKSNIESRSSRDVNVELDLRGQLVLDALMEVDKFIDQSIMTGLTQVTIIHGKGTGALRTAVQAHLRKHPSVRTFRLGVYGEGEAGVTIAELK